MSEVRGRWSPALLAAARIAVGTATARPSSPAWTDARGTLTRADLARTVLATARELPPGPVVVHSEDQRAVAVESLAGLVARRSVRIVPPSAGATALESARRSSAGRGVSFFTSGSTGDPTLRHTRRGPLATAQLISPLGLLPIPRHPSVGCLSPVDHGHGWSVLLLTLLLGGHFISATRDARPIRAAGRVDLLTGLPLLLREFAFAATRPRIGLVLSGSDRLEDADDLATRLGAPVYDAYGSTEAGTLCLASPEDRLRSPGTVGRPLSGVRIREREDVLEARSPMLGGAAFRGDRGHVRDGLVHVSGRADRSVVTGGVVTDPARLRRSLLAIEGVESVDLEAVDDPRFGSRQSATLHARHPLDPEDVRARIRAELGAAATPARVRIVRIGP